MSIFGIAFGPESSTGILLFGPIFGSDGVAVAPEVVVEIASYKADHVALAIKRLPEQFKSKTKIVQFLTALVSSCQALEDALWQLIDERTVETAIGTQLDQLGSIVGQPRGGLSDTDYRPYIRARIMTNRSRGAVEDLIRITKLILADELATIEVDSQRGTVVVRIADVTTTDAVAEVVISFLRDGVAGGIRATLESSPDVEAEMFTTARPEWLAGAVLVGASALPVYFNPDDPNLELWPASGMLVIDEGTATEETLAYTVNHAVGSPFNLTGVTAFAHGDEAPITLVDASAKGLGDSSEAGHPQLTPYASAGVTGGRMADARN